MSKSIVAEGKTTNEAIEKGLKELKVTKNMVDIKVLESGEKRSFFSILAPRVVKVQLTVKENEKHENVKKDRKEFLEKTQKDAKYSIEKTSSGLKVNINNENLGFLIGYRGETLYAFQTILSTIASKGTESRVRVVLDIEGYKAKREKALEDLAEKLEKTVIKTKKSVTLEPMQAYERKIIHAKLQNSDKVETRSIGEEPRRRVVISLKRN